MSGQPFEDQDPYDSHISAAVSSEAVAAILDAAPVDEDSAPVEASASRVYSYETRTGVRVNLQYETRLPDVFLQVHLWCPDIGGPDVTGYLHDETARLEEYTVTYDAHAEPSNMPLEPEWDSSRQ